MAGNGASAATDQRHRVETAAGPVQGIVRATTVQYLGIPFGAPPVGELRWRPPVKAQPWTNVRDASQAASHCLQALPSQDGINSSEDCLYLNVYAPKSTLAGKDVKPSPKPVMVWIYGGANFHGASNIFDATPLAETGDVVVVTLNYRVGPLGFLAHPALDAEDHPAVNYGVMDQQLALQWVRENIARFGGDSKNVTIFGESAGGMNSATHLISPLSAGLFDKAIIQSGAYQLDTPSLADSEVQGAAFAARVGCRDAATAAACLRALPADKLMAEGGEINTLAAAHPQSTVDGKILPEAQRAAFAAGHFKRVPVLAGSTRDEPPVFNCGALDSLHSFSKVMPVYAYEFADPAASPQGATHASEIQYFFNLTDLKGAPETRLGPALLPPDSRKLADLMMRTWAAFARTGSPKTKDLPSWPVGSEGIQVLKPNDLSVVSHEAFSQRFMCDTQTAKSLR